MYIYALSISISARQIVDVTVECIIIEDHILTWFAFKT